MSDAAGEQGRPAARSRGKYFHFNPDLPGARPNGRAFVHIRARWPRTPDPRRKAGEGGGRRVE